MKLHSVQAALFNMWNERGRAVYSMSVAVFTLDNHIANMDPDAHIDAPVIGQPLVAPRHLALQQGRALDRIDYAAELSQQAVAHQFEDAAAVLGDFGSNSSFRCARKRSNVSASFSAINRL